MAALGYCLRWIRFLFPPVVTGTFVVLIGLTLVPVGFAYVGGGFGAEDFGATAGNLFFQGNAKGEFAAYAADSGEKL